MNASRTMFMAYLLCLFLPACHSRRHADLILHNGQVYTVDSGFHDAEAFAVRDGRILAVGSEREIMDHYEADSLEDAGGHAVFPGFIDAHAHFLSYGQSLFSVRLAGSASFEEVVDRVRQFAAARPGEPWITGRGWDQNKFPGKTFPENSLLNAAFPLTPVVLGRVDGHALIANARALDLAGIRPGQHVDGGVVETKNGRLTGILIDNAQRLMHSKMPVPTQADYARWLLAAQQECFAQGLTTVTDCGLDANDIDRIDSLQQQGRLLMRLYIMFSDTRENLKRALARGPYKTDRLFVKAVKVYADGALGSRGACLLQPYADEPGWKGFLLSPLSHYDSLAKLLAGTDFQMCTHAIGDSANRVILKLYNKYLKGTNDRRWRIEHAQVINDRDFDLFGNASIIPSVQPTHATSDMYWAGNRLGPEREKGAYACKRLLEQNGWLPLGTDFPVEDISPFKTFFAAVFRVDARGTPGGGFQIENALSRKETIMGMTIWAAKADFLEKEVGSLEAGKRADFIILDRDLMKVPEEEVLSAKVIATFSGGRRVYSSSKN
ncbi:MAG: amidohydrolase [Bacteroidota bacterium]|nr:amidohydrolase [Bacteroidota bacterium]MDP4216928.1 amidohydrolase [Bacteroidota bacterium]MDP4248306.1 amidohydrolase [Bacteroidota bacterium]MDP4257106.1 amidohydrolase [Bacteroidota bacterium]